jgi:putative endonuclease
VSLSTVWHLYLLECVDGSLYTGITTDVARRYEAHANGKGARYTRSHPPQRLLASVAIGSRSDALKAELELKARPRGEKLAAIQSMARPANG